MKYILVSACLLGLACRYDGKAKENASVRALLDREDITLIPVCPEQLGGMKTPRSPAERQGSRVVNQEGNDVTVEYRKGAIEAGKLAEIYGCREAILKENSPSCGCGSIYDGTFRHILTEGDGVTAEYLKQQGLVIWGESDIEQRNI